jgi:hypothetical protein
VDVNKAWETIRENVQISAKENLDYYELKNYKPSFDEGCSKLLDHRFSDVRQIETDTAEPLIPDPSPFEVEIDIAKFKRYKSPDSDQILVELIQAGGALLHS